MIYNVLLCKKEPSVKCLLTSMALPLPKPKLYSQKTYRYHPNVHIVTYPNLGVTSNFSESIAGHHIGPLQLKGRPHRAAPGLGL